MTTRSTSLKVLHPCFALAILFAGCWMATYYLDIASVYHEVKAQSVLKLYVIINTLEIFDKLCAALSQVSVW